MSVGLPRHDDADITVDLTTPRPTTFEPVLATTHVVPTQPSRLLRLLAHSPKYVMALLDALNENRIESATTLLPRHCSPV